MVCRARFDLKQASARRERKWVLCCASRGCVPVCHNACARRFRWSVPGRGGRPGPVSAGADRWTRARWFRCGVPGRGGQLGPVAAGGRSMEARWAIRAVGSTWISPLVGRSRSKVTNSTMATSAAPSSTGSTPRPRIAR